MTVIAKRELLFAGTFGICGWLSGLIFIDRKSDKGKVEMNKAINYLKEERVKLWVFPEGTRRNNGMIHAFKKGAFHIAIDAQIPIVPLVFSSYRNFLDEDQKIFKKSEIIITAMPEISTQGMTLEDIGSLIEQIRSQMIKVYDETSEESAKIMLNNSIKK